ncbi:formylglycine-generating enzyme family protein [Lutispora sp.]|uniref:formylglycine-generating enzyme family protein n=1 Tax=Lutispora sp. TaxID=2828727 RepID=UPI003567642C
MDGDKLSQNKIHIDGMDFIEIESCRFIMGTIDGDELATALEKRRNIWISKSFYVQTTPVTTGQYFKFINETGYDHDYYIEKWDGEDWVIGPHFMEINSRGENYPIVGVSYYDAHKYIEWASKKHGKTFRLPTEAEFELAARSGCKCIGNCKYAMLVNQEGLSRKEEEKPRSAPREVKKGIVTEIGLYDMHGLVWQWCEDWFFHYDSEELVDPKGPEKEPHYAPWKGERWAPGKVIRGGSFNYPYYHSRCSNRHYSKPSDRNINVGFRLFI